MIAYRAPGRVTKCGGRFARKFSPKSAHGARIWTNTGAKVATFRDEAEGGGPGPPNSAASLKIRARSTDARPNSSLERKCRHRFPSNAPKSAEPSLRLARTPTFCAAMFNGHGGTEVDQMVSVAPTWGPLVATEGWQKSARHRASTGQPPANPSQAWPKSCPNWFLTGPASAELGHLWPKLGQSRTPHLDDICSHVGCG